MEYDALKLENQLCFPLYASSKEIIKKYKPFLDPLGITYTQYITLMSLWEKDNISVKNLGKMLYLDSGTLTPLLKKLESHGLITRERSSTDERSVYIRLTKFGVDLKAKAVSIPLAIGGCINLSLDEIILLQRLLNKLLTGSIEEE